MKMPVSFIVFGMVLALMVSVSAQDPFGITAPTSAMDTLAGGSGGPPTQTYMDRMNMARDGFGQNVRERTGISGDQMPGMPGAPGDPMQFGAGMDKTITVWEGDVIRDAITKGLLDDAFREIVPESEKSNFTEDRRSGAQSSDGEYVNVKIVDEEFLGPQTNALKIKTLNSLLHINQVNPIKFSGAYAASNEFVTSLPKTIDLEEDRDVTLQRWLKRLEKFRKPLRDGSGYGELYRVHVPRAPQLPHIPKPQQDEIYYDQVEIEGMGPQPQFGPQPGMPTPQRGPQRTRRPEGGTFRPATPDDWSHDPNA